MYAFCCKQRSLLYNRFALNLRNSLILEMYDVQSIRILPIKFFSSRKKSISLSEGDDKQQQKHSSAVSYLIDSCGVSPEAALSASKMVHFESSKGPDSVLALLRNYGFENSHISRLIGRYPKLLSANPEKTLMPKLEFFSSIGFSGSELPKFICSSPKVLNHSLENRVVPTYDFLKSIVGDDNKVIVVLRRGWWLISGADVQRHIVPNIALLREFGVPQSVIVFLVTSCPSVLSNTREKFDARVKEVIKMGFNPSKTGFVCALAAMSEMSKSTWQHKVEVYKKWGWSDTDISLAFRKNPICLRASETKIGNVMDFLVNKMGIESIAIARSPTVLTYSLEKRIIPRCLVVRFLQLKGFLKKDIHMLGCIKMSEEVFLGKFVTTYGEQVPQVLDLYHGKVDLQELVVRTEDLTLEALM